MSKHTLVINGPTGHIGGDDPGCGGTCTTRPRPLSDAEGRAIDWVPVGNVGALPEIPTGTSDYLNLLDSPARRKTLLVCHPSDLFGEPYPTDADDEPLHMPSMRRESEHRSGEAEAIKNHLRERERLAEEMLLPPLSLLEQLTAERHGVKVF